ncbi:MAG: hypothetical protein Q9191_006546 [Dirinaria sp. TL-2023a]
MPPKKAALVAAKSRKRKASATDQPVTKRSTRAATASMNKAQSLNEEVSAGNDAATIFVNEAPSLNEEVSRNNASSSVDISTQALSSSAEACSPGAVSTSSTSQSAQVLSTSADVSSSEVVAALPNDKALSWVPPTKKESAMLTKLLGAAAINAAKPRAFGKPLVFAETRQALCESLPYYRAYQSSAYTHGGRVYGVMLDYALDDSAYMDEEIIIHKTGGGCRITNDALREQIVDHKRTDSTVQSFLKNWDNNDPLAVILGSRNTHCPAAMPHRYNVLGWFVVTHVWPEPNGGKIAFKVRLQKLDLGEKSWWAAEKTPSPPQVRDFAFQALRQSCDLCSQTSSQIYTIGWTCLNEHCEEYCQINGVKVQDFALNPDFLAEREVPQRKPSTALVPSTLKDDAKNPTLWASRSAWRGVPCERCGNCIAAKDWHYWKCDVKGCNWMYSLKKAILPAALFLPDEGMGYWKHARIENFCRYPFQAWTYQIHGNFLVSIYQVMPANYIVHIHASNPENIGIDNLFEAMQGNKEIPLQRNMMSGACLVEGGLLTKHFAVNYGAQYKYVAAVGMLSFSEAPKPIMKALGRITWACSFALGLLGVTEYEKPNELLAVGYKEGNEMGYHDDGEKGLGITVGSLSLGGEADFSFRMKDGHWSPKMMMTDPEKYDPAKIVLEGSKFWKERRDLNSKFGHVSKTQFEKEKMELYSKWKNDTAKENRGRECPVLLKMKLKHGDYVIMHGAEIQQYFEHAAKPTDKLRFALTARTIDMDLAEVPESKREMADFSLKDDEIYSPNLSNDF